jgi:hypothetical protein
VTDPPPGCVARCTSVIGSDGGYLARIDADTHARPMGAAWCARVGEGGRGEELSCRVIIHVALG